MFALTRYEIDVEATRMSVGSSGAVSVLVNLVGEKDARDLDLGGREASILEAGEGVVRRAIDRFGLLKASVIHRTGSLREGDVLMVAAVSAPRYQDAIRGLELIAEEVRQVMAVHSPQEVQSRQR